MRIIFSALAGALIVSSAPVLAQATRQLPRAAGASASASTKSSTDSKLSGFDLIVEAARIYIPGIEGAPSTKQRMQANENLMAQRQSVSRNAKSLKMVHEALLLPMMTPPYMDARKNIDYEAIRTLGRLLKQEANVKTTTADWLGSVNTQLDLVELGIAITRGAGLQAAEAGLSLENLGHLGMNTVLPRLSPQECQQVAARILKIEALRPSAADILRVEKTHALVFTQYSVENRDWERVINGQPDEDPMPAPNPGMMGGDMGDTEGRGGMGAAPAAPPPEGPFTAREITQLRNIGLGELQTNLTRYFDTLVANASVPYGAALARVAPPADPWSRYLTSDISQPSIRLSSAAARTQNLLLSQALNLGAIRTLTGKYPTALEAAPDPFRPAERLIYKPVGDAYLLYSVGPDGKDDAGERVKVTPFTRDDQPAAVTGGLDLTTTGDIVAPVL